MSDKALGSVYECLPLPSAATHIRLLKLLPTSDAGSSSRLQCQLFTAPLAQPPSFIALSYTWGDSNEAHQLHLEVDTVSGTQGAEASQLPITPSLDEALRHIRKPSDTVTLWVDQVCIDQRNVPEKNAQVAKMGEIYSLASLVLIWHGPASEDSDWFIERMHAVATMAHEEGIGRYFDRGKRTDEEYWDFMSKVIDFGASPDEDDPLQDSIAKASTELFGIVGDKQRIASASRAWLDRPWFTRVWVLQEYALAAKAAFLCGTRTIETEQFTLGHTVLTILGAGRRALQL